MPLDPHAKALLDQMAAMNLPPIQTLEPAMARAMFDAIPVPTPLKSVAETEDRTIPGPAGAIPIRVYRSPGDSGTLVFFHGGGFMVGGIASHDEVCHTLATSAGCSVVSVDYRMAPEDPFPAAPEDCYAATAWIAAHGAELGIDTGRVAVGGDSAGGNLSAAISIMARDRGGPRIALQLLIYPAVDMDFTYPSFQENAVGYGLELASCEYFTKFYAPDESTYGDPRLSPIRAESHRDLPPALIQTAGFDPLRDQGPAYAEKLRAAGVEAACTCYEGMIHGFYNYGAEWTARADAVAEASRALRSVLSPAMAL